MRVMAEDERHRDVAAVDGAVLGIRDGHIERDVLAEVEGPAVDRHVTVTVGAVLPTVIVVFATPILPLESITESFAVN